MMLHSLREPFRGTALATILSMLVISLTVVSTNIAHAERISQADTSLRTDSPQSGDALDNDHALVNPTLVLKKDKEIAFAESSSDDISAIADDCSLCGEPSEELDRFWLINTRHLTSSAHCLNLDDPALAIYRINHASCPSRVTLDQYLQELGQRRSAVVYVHGNRIPANEAIERGFAVYQNVKCRRSGNPVDWVIWSWQSDQEGILIHDARRKASRTDGQGLYLGWVLRKHAELKVNTTLIGYSFGGRIITGALHAAAGGSLDGRQLPGTPVVGGPFGAGLVAPAVDSHWLASHGYHKYATQNLERLVLLYNRRDAVLKRYWLIDRVRGRMALGFSGPTSFANRFDGTKLPVLSRDCSPSIGLQHDELDYYRKSCQAGSEMAKLIDDLYANE